MTKQKDLKKRIRAYAEEYGMSYLGARRVVLDELKRERAQKSAPPWKDGPRDLEDRLDDALNEPQTEREAGIEDGDDDFRRYG